MRGVVAAVAVLVLVASLAGCAGPKPAAAADGALHDGRADLRTGNVTTVERTSSWLAGASAAGHDPKFLGTGTPVERVKGENLTGVIVEMAWTAATALSERMVLRVWERGSGAEVGSVAGTSPLRLVLPGQAAAGDLVLEGDAEDPGAFANQECTIDLTAFHGAPFDPAYSALAH